MLTLFTVPKPFTGLAGVHQRNALYSWTLLSPAARVIVFGDEAGIADAAVGLGLTHHARVARSEHGTPLLNSVFRAAYDASADCSLLGYVNADIVLLPDFLTTIELVSRWRKRFLLVGRRWDLDSEDSLLFDARWVEELRAAVRATGKLRDEWWIDYLVFPRGLWIDIPAFAVGRPAWDNWMVYDAIRRGIPVVDATTAITAVHQRHDYAHVPQSRGDYWRGPEGDRNSALAGGRVAAYSIQDATHEVRRDRVRRRYTLQPVRRLWERWERKPGLAGRLARAGRRALRGPRAEPAVAQPQDTQGEAGSHEH